jgi:rubredoxin
MTAVRKSTKASFKLEGREVPEGHQRSPRVQEYIDRNRCPDCGAFSKPLWLPPPSLGTDPKWQCKNCGART